MQRLKRTIKKIMALGAGGAMLSASITGALAADLGDYPAPFVTSGRFDPSTAVVVGANAAASDTLGSVDIATQLQFDSKICVPSAGAPGSVTITGDAVEIGDASDLLELREPIGDVRETLTEIELDGLAGGIVTTNEGTTEFNQYLRFQELDSTENDTIRSPQVNFTKNDAPVDEVGDWLFIREGSTSNESFFEYELEFEDGLESDIKSSKLEDLEDEEIIMLGTTYTFVDTKIDTAKDEVTLEMLGGAVYDVLEEGEVKTYTIDGKEYEVEVLIIEDTSPATVTFSINGEVTDQLVDGETEILQDGTLIGISDIILNEAGEAGSGDLVEVYIGATKVEFKDNNYSDSETAFASGSILGFESRVEIDEEAIEDAFVQIKGNELDSGTKFEVFSVKYRLTADALPGYKDIFVPPGHGVREFLDEPQGMLGIDWDIRYEGLDDTGVSVIKIDPSGDDEYNIEFENRQGLVYKVPYISAEPAGSGVWKFGDDDDDLVFVESNLSTSAIGQVIQNNTFFNIGILDYFIVSNVDKNTNAGRGDINLGQRTGGMRGINRQNTTALGGFDDTSITHVLRYNSIDTANTQLSFDELATGSKEFVYESVSTSAVEFAKGKAELVFGGNTYVAYISNYTESGGDNPLAIDMDNDGNIDRTEIRITVNGGGILDLGNAAYSDGGVFESGAVSVVKWKNTQNETNQIGINNITFNLTTLSENFDENKPSTTGGTASANEHITFNIVNRTDNRIGVDTTTMSVFIDEPDEDDDNLYGMSDYGVFINVFDPEGTDDAETVTIEYPLVQRGARIFITMGDVSTTKTTAGEVCSVADIDLGNMLDAEVADPTDYNLIVVGGPCANDIAAEIFMTCAEWTLGPGEGLLKLADNGDKVALLIAGTEAVDTRVASKVLANYEDYDLSGSEVTVSGTISSPRVEVA